MIKVGLVGEDPNDTESIKNLLSKRYIKTVRFCFLAKGVKGHQLDSPKIKKVVKLEMQDQGCNFIVFVRDLDGFATENAKVKAKEAWFNDLNAQTGNGNVFLLNIWELEALIFADIEKFNKRYKIKHHFPGDPTMIKEPKERLMDLTRKSQNRYKESHCPEIFEELDIDLIKQRCKFFGEFLDTFDKKI